MISDYINKGYRIYKLEDFNIANLVGKLPLLQRLHHIEILVKDRYVMVKNTNKYNSPKNPYL